MKTELKDVIHFYIGCKVTHVTRDKEVIDIERMIGVSESEMYPGKITAITSDNHTEWAASDVLPILRRLSSMTEEEKREFKKLIPWIDFVKFLPGDQWQYYEHEEEDNHQTRPVCLTTSSIKTLPLCVGNWCRKNSFDIDGLIDSSQAIEQTPDK